MGDLLSSGHQEKPLSQARWLEADIDAEAAYRWYLASSPWRYGSSSMRRLDGP